MDGLGNIIFLVILFGVFYMLLVRPNKKRAEAHKQLVNSIEEGDEVVTGGGLFGRVTAVGDEQIELEIAPGTRVKFLKGYVLRRVDEDLESSDDGDVSEAESA
ncbi:MAG: preprotein translocase subunit YajC [Actinomycetota bacterium]